MVGRHYNVSGMFNNFTNSLYVRHTLSILVLLSDFFLQLFKYCSDPDPNPPSQDSTESDTFFLF